MTENLEVRCRWRGADAMTRCTESVDALDYRVTGSFVGDRNRPEQR